MTEGSGREAEGDGTLLDEDARKRIWRAASEFLYSALDRIEVARSFPLPGRESPWMDENQVWNILGRDMGSPLTEAIEKELPERGKIGSGYPWPKFYPMALLRAVIAEATLAHERPGGGGIQARFIDEMLDELENPAQSNRALHLLTALDVSAVAGEVVHHVRLEPVRGLQQTISEHMKEAAAEALRLPIVTMGSREPRAIAICDITYATKDEWEVRRQSTAHFWHVLTAIRLATSATVAHVLDIDGRPGMVHVYPPSIRAVDPEPETHMWRVAALTPSDLEGMEALAQTLCDLDAEVPAKGTPSVILAINRFNRTHRPAGWQDHVVDLSIGFEAALSSGEREDLTLALRTRAAHLLAVPGDPPSRVFADVGELTGLRGKVVHGVPVPPKDLEALFKRRGADQVFAYDQIAVVVDRWRDLLRRAILARLMLGETGGGAKAPWGLRAGNISVDGILVGPAGRGLWRRTINSRVPSALRRRGSGHSHFVTPSTSRTARASTTR